MIYMHNVMHAKVTVAFSVYNLVLMVIMVETRIKVTFAYESPSTILAFDLSTGAVTTLYL